MVIGLNLVAISTYKLYFKQRARARLQSFGCSIIVSIHLYTNINYDFAFFFSIILINFLFLEFRVTQLYAIILYYTIIRTYRERYRTKG